MGSFMWLQSGTIVSEGSLGQMLSWVTPQTSSQFEKLAGSQLGLSVRKPARGLSRWPQFLEHCGWILRGKATEFCGLSKVSIQKTQEGAAMLLII